MARWNAILALALALVLVSACGRVGFDPVSVSIARTVHLYAVSGADIQIYDVASDGSLTLSPSSPYTLDVGAHDLRGDANGEHLYVATSNGTTGQIETFAIDAATGALTKIDSQPSSTYPEVIAIHPGGRWLYASNWDNQPVVYGYTIALDGTLAAMPGSPFAHGGADSSFIGIDPKGRWLYASSDDHYVYGFAISSTDGSLTAVPAIRWNSNDSGPWCVLVESTGRFGWVAPDTQGGVPGFTINQQDGSLTTTPGSKFGAHGNTTFDATLDHTGTRAFFANQGEGSFSITAYAINATTGALADLPGSPIPTAATYSALSVAASPVSDDVYFGGGAPPTVRHYRATAAGITLVDTADIPSAPDRLTVVASASP